MLQSNDELNAADYLVAQQIYPSFRCGLIKIEKAKQSMEQTLRMNEYRTIEFTFQLNSSSLQRKKSCAQMQRKLFFVFNSVSLRIRIFVYAANTKVKFIHPRVSWSTMYANENSFMAPKFCHWKVNFKYTDRYTNEHWIHMTSFILNNYHTLRFNFPITFNLWSSSVPLVYPLIMRLFAMLPQFRGKSKIFSNSDTNSITTFCRLTNRN